MENKKYSIGEYGENNYNNNYGGNDKMGEGSLNATEIAVGSLLAGGRGYGGYGGGGAWGGYGGGYGPFASPGANAVRLNRNAQFIENQADCTREVLGRAIDSNSNSFENLTRQNQFDRLCDRISEGAMDNRDQIFRQELRNGDRLRDIEREMNANARIAADCCCDLKLQAANDKSEIMARMEALSKEGITRDLDRAEREIIALRGEIARCKPCPQPCPPPCPCPQ